MTADPSRDQTPGGNDFEAAEWFVKKDRGFTEEERQAFQRWLEGDPENRAESMRKHEKTWARFQEMDPGFLEKDRNPGIYPEPAAGGTARSIQPWMAWVAIGMAALVVFMLFLSTNPSGSGMDFEGRIAVEEYETRILPDGTILELNEGARAKIKFTGKIREVQLHSGEIYFHVAHDPERPFEVYAGGARVRALGTAFNLRYTEEVVQVAVTEGRIQFSDVKHTKSKGSESSAPAFSRDLSAGEISTMVVKNTTSRAEFKRLEDGELEKILAWKPETLVFRSAPLGDVVTAFNKRNKIQLVLEDEELETMPIEANFRSNKVEAFARLLELSFDIQVEQRGPNRLVLSRKSTS